MKIIFVIIEIKKIKFNDSTFSLMMNNKNREIREIVYKTYI